MPFYFIFGFIFWTCWGFFVGFCLAMENRRVTWANRRKKTKARRSTSLYMKNFTIFPPFSSVRWALKINITKILRNEKTETSYKNLFDFFFETIFKYKTFIWIMFVFTIVIVLFNLQYYIMIYEIREQTFTLSKRARIPTANLQRVTWSWKTFALSNIRPAVFSKLPTPDRVGSHTFYLFSLIWFNLIIYLGRDPEVLNWGRPWRRAPLRRQPQAAVRRTADPHCSTPAAIQPDSLWNKTMLLCISI